MRGGAPYPGTLRGSRGALARFRDPGERAPGMWLAVAAAAAVGVALASSPVPRITPDSATYLTGAERLAEDGRFESCDGPIALFAPGYSAAMAPLLRLGLDAPQAARVVNVLATFLLVLGAAALANGAGLSRRACTLTAVAVAASYVALRDGALAWSEPLFGALLSWLLVIVVNGGKGLAVRVSPRVAAAVLLTWAILLTRHSGVFLLPAVGLAAWLGTDATRRRPARVGAFLLAVLVVPGAWWLRNVDVDGEPFGRRSGPGFTPLEVLRQLPDGLSSLAVPTDVPYPIRLLVLVPVAFAAYRAACRGRSGEDVRLTVLVLGTTIAAYVLGVTLAAMRTVVDPIDTRLLSPILVPAVVLVALGVTAPSTEPRRLVERALSVWAIALMATMVLLAPGVVWRGHTMERDLSVIADDVSCAEWPARYPAPPR